MLINFPRNNYEPDIVFFGQEKSKDFTPDQMLFPAPDLVVEVLSESTQENDYGIKFEDYQHNQVPEYWIIDPDAQSVEQFLLQDEKYVLYQKLAKSGTLKTNTVPGFAIELEKSSKPRTSSLSGASSVPI
ncbi:MAG: Uma2 family endonuclease [Bacteroidia bacterium]|nr:Uma2 family endonuclease [Bacteroidia bacterium]